MKSQSFIAIMLMLTLFVGCEVPELEVPLTPEELAAKKKMDREDSGLPPAEKEEEAPAATPAEPAENSTTNTEQAPAGEAKEFTVQDAKKGKKSRQAGGYLGAIGNARFSIEHKAILANMEKALDLYNADKGYYPKTQEEFEEKILKDNKIVLPELEADEEYVYDPEEPKVLKFRKKQP